MAPLPPRSGGPAHPGHTLQRGASTPLPPPPGGPPPETRPARRSRAGLWLVAIVLVGIAVAARFDRLAAAARPELRRLLRAVAGMAGQEWRAVPRPAPSPAPAQAPPAPPRSAAPATAADAPEAGVRVTLSHATATPGERVTASFAGLSGPSQTDWISLFRISDPNTSYGEWFYLRGVEQGTVTFTAPGAPGDYEARLFRDWPGGQYVSVAKSGPLQVGAAPRASAPASAAEPPSLALDRLTFAPGELVRVRFRTPRYADDAWIGVIPSDVQHGSEPVNDQHDVSYQYLRGRTEGELVFTAPAAGRWDLRLNTTDSNGIETASVSFVVAASKFDLTGVWRGEDGSHCRARQDGDEVWWLCDPARAGHSTLMGVGSLRGEQLTLRVVELEPRPAAPGAGSEAARAGASTSLVLVHEPPDALTAPMAGAQGGRLRTWRRR